MFWRPCFSPVIYLLLPDPPDIGVYRKRRDKHLQQFFLTSFHFSDLKNLAPSQGRRSPRVTFLVVLSTFPCFPSRDTLLYASLFYSPFFESLALSLHFFSSKEFYGLVCVGWFVAQASGSCQPQTKWSRLVDSDRFFWKRSHVFMFVCTRARNFSARSMAMMTIRKMH